MNKKVLRILGIISIPMMYIVFFLATKYISYLKFSLDLLFIASIAIIYVSLHFFLDIKKMYKCMFKFRYLIGIAIFAFLVIGGYHGSSISNWNDVINPNTEVENGRPILGIPRGIRSDEWLVTTTHNLSQANEKVNFSNVNSLMTGKETKVNFYPRLIVKDMGMIIHPEHWGYLFLPLENAFSFQWYFGIFASFFVILELFMLITKKNKLYSTLGAFLLVISPPTFWWNMYTYTLYGGLALLVINKFINTKKIIIKLILSAILGIIAACYLSIMYPAWMIPFAYFFIAIFIWLLIENKDKIKWKDLLYLFVTALVCIVLFLPLYLNNHDVFEIVSNTVYPGSRASYGGGSFSLLFTYISNIFFPYVETANSSEFSQYLSLFPIPIIMGVYYLIKNIREKKTVDWFLLLTCTLTICLFIWCAIPLPKFLSKITLLTMSTSYRTQMIVGYACIFIFVYVLSRYQIVKRKKLGKSDSILLMLLSVLITVTALWFSNSAINIEGTTFINSILNIISLILFVPLIYLLLTNYKKTNILLFIILMVINLIGSVLISPFSKGLNVLYEKPFAKEIQNIVKNQPDAKFLTVDSSVTLANYILVNGGYSIMSTNFIPNLDLWHKLDQKGVYNEVYNRYSHIVTALTDVETNFELIQNDMIGLNLNYDDICKLDVDYIASIKVQQEKEKYYTEIYNYDNTYIYKVKCN